MKYHRAHVAVAGFNGELYAVGGIGTRCFHAVLINSSCYLRKTNSCFWFFSHFLGGLKENDDGFLSTVEKLDTLTNTWSVIAPMHEERAFHSASSIDCNIYSLGGCSGKIWLRTVERYEKINRIWFVK